MDVKNQEPAVYNVEWDGKNENGVPVSSGIYFYHLEAKSMTTVFSRTKKMMLLK